MKNKIVIGIIIVTIILLITIAFLSINVGVNKSDNYISEKGYKIFGSNYCSKHSTDYFYEDNEHSMISGQAFTSYECNLCNKKYNHPNTGTPKICSKCATITNRCTDCGMLNSAE